MFILEYSLLTLGILFLVGCLDDIIIDVTYILGRVKPRVLSKARWDSWKSIKEKPLAIMIPAWQESSVLEAMVRTNLKRIQYKNYRWFLGVYPNDTATVEIAQSLEARYPDMVTVVITDRPGPTSKAHCLNCILTVIEDGIKEGKWEAPHYAAIHDAEDVIHPQSFRAINGQRSDLDFIQVPIFSLNVPLKSLVAGTYLDEFAEIHLKDMPVRQLLKCPIPSAGVGTFFSWKILGDVKKLFGYWFDDGVLTEDYEIALRIARMDGKQRFLLLKDEEGKIIATREYFPDEFKRSIRQKTRWTTGMGFQMIAKWGTYGAIRALHKYKNVATCYALWRDRKALWANLLTISGWFLMLASITLLSVPSLKPYAGSHSYKLLTVLLVINFAVFGIRIFARAYFCGQLYGFKHGLVAIPRVLLSNVINCSACVASYKQYFFAVAKKQSTTMKWDKTDHKFPTMEALE